MAIPFFKNNDLNFEEFVKTVFPYSVILDKNGIIKDIYGKPSIKAEKGISIQELYPDINWGDILLIKKSFVIPIVLDNYPMFVFRRKDYFYIVPSLKHMKIPDWINHIKYPIMIIHPSGYIEKINDEIKNICPTIREGINIVDIFSPDMMNDILRAINRTISGGTSSIDVIKIDENKYISLSFGKIRVEDKDLIIVLLQDVSEFYKIRDEKERFEEFSRGVFDSIDQGFVILDKRGIIKDFNLFMNRKHKWDNEIIGKNIFNIVDGVRDRQLDKKFTEVMETGRGTYIENIHVKSREVGEIIYDIFAYPLKYGDSIEGVIVILNDVTEKRQLEQQIKKKTLKEELLSLLSHSLLFAKDIEGVFKELIRIIDKYISIIESEGIIIEKQSLFVPVIKYDKGKFEETKKESFSLSDLSPIVSKVVRTGTIMIEKIRNDDSSMTKIGVPLNMDNRMIGLLIIATDRENIGEDEIEFLETTVSYASIAIEKLHLLEREKETVDNLNLFLSVTQTLSGGINYKESFEKVSDILLSFFNADGVRLLVKYKGESFHEVAQKGRVLHKFVSMDYDSQVVKTYSYKDRTVILLPIEYKDFVIGIIQIERESDFNDNEKMLISGIAKQIAPQLHTYIMYKTVEDRLSNITILYNVNQRIKEANNINMIEAIVNYIVSNVEYIDDILMFGINSHGQLRYIYGKGDSKVLKKEERGSLYRISGGISLSEEFKELRTYDIIDKISEIGNVFYIERQSIGEEEVFIALGSKDKDKHANYIENFEFLKMLIGEMFSMIREIYLSEEAKKKWQEILVIGQTVAGLGQMQDLNSLLEYIVKSAANLTESKMASLLLIDENNMLKFEAIYGLEREKLKGVTLPVGFGIAGMVAKTGESVLTNNAMEHPYYLKMRELYYDVKTLINVPLIVNEEIIGVLCVDNSINGYYTKDEERILNILASVSSAAIYNARLHDQTLRQLKKESLINDITSILYSADDYEDLWDKVGKRIEEDFSLTGFTMLVHGHGEIINYYSYGEDSASIKELVDKMKDMRRNKTDVYYVKKELGSNYYYYYKKLKNEFFCILSFVFDNKVEKSFISHLGHLLVSFYENVQLLNESKRRLQELEVIYRIANIFNEETSFESALQKVADTIHRYLSLKYVDIIIYDSNSNVFRVEASSDRNMKGKINKELDATEENSVVIRSFVTGKVINISNVNESQIYKKVRDDVSSELAVPLKWHDEKMGVLNIESDEEDAFPLFTERMFVNIGDQIARFMKNSQLYKQVKEVESMKNYIFDGIDIGMMIIDMEGNINDFNRIIRDKYTKEGKFEDIFKKDDIVKINEAIKNKINYETWETQTINGIDIKTTLRVLRENRKRRGYLLIIEDITEKKEMEERLEKEKDLAKMGEMAAAMAHEIKNPLASIKLGAQFIYDREESSDRKFLLTKMIDEINRLDSIVKDMTNFSKQPTISPSVTDIEKVVDEAIGICLSDSRYKENIKIEKKVDKIGEVCIDGDRIKEVLINIIMNAVQAFNGRKGKIVVNVSRKKDFLIIKIKDNAGGVPEDIKDKIFTPFFTTKKEGTGLGLSICRKIMIAHGGNLTFKNVKNGVEFTLKAKIYDGCDKNIDNRG